MSLKNDNVRWIRRGRQHAAVAQVLRRPMTTTEICTAARQIAPRIQLRDVWLMLQEMRERGLVICLNPKHVTGKLYTLTLRGRRTVRQVFCTSVRRAPAGIDWRKYARIARAKVRRLVLLELARVPPETLATATTVRKGLRESHPIGLNPTIRALKELEQLGLVRSEPVSDRDSRKRYFLSNSGAAIARQINA